MRKAIRWVALLAAFGPLGAALAETASPGATMPRYDHVFLIIEENHGFGQIIGNPQAPNLNALATEYGLATQFFSVADPSAPNYVAMLGGDFYGIADDNPYFTHNLDKLSLMSELDAAGMSWKGYFQGMPYAGYREFCYPGRCNGVPDFDPFYSSKHNGIIYFHSVNARPAERRKMVPIEQLATDLAGELPAFVYIVPDQCHDMHGSPPWCGDSGNPGDVNDNQLVSRGDVLAGELVATIVASPIWARGNDAIVITFDEGNGTATCCGVPGTGRVATLVITNRGPRGLKDPTPYNHYSLLRTIEEAFGLSCIAHACDPLVQPMLPLFAIAK
jgi:phospholipase C